MIVPDLIRGPVAAFCGEFSGKLRANSRIQTADCAEIRLILERHSMRSRYFHALCAWAAYVGLAALYATFLLHSLDLVRVAAWSVAGIAGHLGLSQLFGFDPYRTQVAAFAPSHVRYIDRWELKLGQATLSLLGSAVVAAHWVDPNHFVTAVVSATLAAWTYFVWRLYVGGYDLPAKVRAR
jgi:hypothetical protein